MDIKGRLKLAQDTVEALEAKIADPGVEIMGCNFRGVEDSDRWDSNNLDGDSERVFYRLLPDPKYRPYTARELGARIGEAFNDVDGNTHFLRMVDDDGCGYWRQRSSCCFAPRTLLNHCTWLNGSKMGVEVESE